MVLDFSEGTLDFFRENRSPGLLFHQWSFLNAIHPQVHSQAFFHGKHRSFCVSGKRSEEHEREDEFHVVPFEGNYYKWRARIFIGISGGYSDENV